jgi:hypothetical protein
MALDPGVAQIASTLSAHTARMEQMQRDMLQQLGGVLSQLSKQSSVNVSGIQQFSKQVISSSDDLKRSFKSVGDITSDTTQSTNVNRERRLYTDRLNNQSHFFNQEERIQAAHLRRLTEELNENKIQGQTALTAAEKQNSAALKSKKAAEAEQAAQQKKYNLGNAVIKNATDVLAKKQKQLEAERNKTIIISQSEHDKALKALEREVTEREKLLDDVTTANSEVIKSYGEYADKIKQAATTIAGTDVAIKEITAKLKGIEPEIAKVDEAFRKANLNASITTFKETLHNGVKDFGKGLMVSGSALLGKGFTDVWKEIHTEINRGASISGVSPAQTAQLGLSRPEFAEAAGEYRRAMLAAGGLGKSMVILNDAQTDLADVMADPKDRTEFALNQMEILAKSGIKPTTEAIKQAGASYKNIQKITGLTGEAFAGLVRDMIDDESTQIEMRRASSQEERKAILANTRARMEENLAMGMTKEQALAVAKAMKASQAKGPMERMKEAIKLQATMGAMGVSGGARAAELARKGTLSKDETAELQGYRSKLSNAVSGEMGGEGPQAFFTEAVTKATGVTEESLAPYNTKALEPIAPAIVQNAVELAQVAQNVKDGLNDIYSGLNAITKNPWAEVIVGALAGLGMVALTSGVFANTAALTENTAAMVLGGKDLVGGLSKLIPAGTLAKVVEVGKGLVKGGAVAVAGEAAQYGGEKLKESGYKKTGGTLGVLGTTAKYAGVGAMLGNIIPIPGVGAAIGATVGGVAGFGKGMYDNWDDMRGNTYPNQAAAKPKPELEPLNQAKINEVSPVTDKIKKTEDTLSTGIDDQTKTTVDASTQQKLTIDQQMVKMVEANSYLKTIADNVPTLVDLAGKQLLASTLTEAQKKEKGASKLRGTLGNLASQYNYI